MSTRLFSPFTSCKSAQSLDRNVGQSGCYEANDVIAKKLPGIIQDLSPDRKGHGIRGCGSKFFSIFGLKRLLKEQM